MCSKAFVEIIDNNYKWLFDIFGSRKIQLTQDMCWLTPNGPMYIADLTKLTDKQLSQFCEVLATYNNYTIEEIENDIIKNGFCIPVGSCLMPHISKEFIALMRKNYKNNIESFSKGRFLYSREGEIHWLSIIIITSMLGQQWHSDNIKKAKLKNEDRMKYLITPQSNNLELSTHHFRTILFADCLFTLQSTKGFQHKLIELRNLSPQKPEVMIEDYISELLIAKMLVDDGNQIVFRKPSRRSGEDYDLDIILKSGINLCGEIKCKRNDTVTNSNSLMTKLGKAANQFPKNKKCVIFIKIPKEMTYERDFRSILESFLSSFFLKQSHIIAVTLIWEESLILANGGSVGFIKSHIIINRNQIFIEIYLKDLFKKNKPLINIANQDSLKVSFGEF